MISKIFTGHSFAGAVKYVVEDERRAEVLEVQGVRDWDYRLMTEDFLRQASLNPAKTKACFHAILSFSPEDKMNDKTMTQIAMNYLVEMGLANTQFAIVKHTDKDHQHVHLLANLVDNKGHSIKNSFTGLKGKRIAQRLTTAFGLKPADKKDLSKTHQEALSEGEAARYQIYQAILSALPFCNTLEDLAYRLKKKDIDTIIKYKSGSTTERQGISFQLGKHVFKGSKVDRSYSLGRLEQKLLFHRQMRMAKRDVLSAYQPSSNPAAFPTGVFKISGGNKSAEATSSLADAAAKGIGELASNLLQPEQGYDPLAGEITRANRKKKKRRHGL
jgi:hypothetical protein